MGLSSEFQVVAVAVSIAHFVLLAVITTIAYIYRHKFTAFRLKQIEIAWFGLVACLFALPGELVQIASVPIDGIFEHCVFWLTHGFATCGISLGMMVIIYRANRLYQYGTKISVSYFDLWAPALFPGIVTFVYGWAPWFIPDLVSERPEPDSVWLDVTTCVYKSKLYFGFYAVCIAVHFAVYLFILVKSWNLPPVFNETKIMLSGFVAYSAFSSIWVFNILLHDFHSNKYFYYIIHFSSFTVGTHFCFVPIIEPIYSFLFDQKIFANHLKLLGK